MRLGIVYHMPFWQAPDGEIREIEGSFARYVDSLAPYVDEISLCVPVRGMPAGEGTRIRAPNVRLAPLPDFDGPRQFYPQLPAIRRRIADWVGHIDLLNCRVPTPAAWCAFSAAQRRGVPTFLLIVGDLRAIAPTLPYRGVKRALFAAYTAFEEQAIMRMARRSVTFANGADLAAKHRRQGADVIETMTSTITAADIDARQDTCERDAIRVLTVSRIDPRKGLRVLPGAIASLRAAGRDVRLDIVGPSVGSAGNDERAAIELAARQHGVTDYVRCLGAMPLDRLMPTYRDYDVFVLPTGPGEGIPRVLLEAMAASLPVVTTRVAGIPSLVLHEQNGLLIDDGSEGRVTEALFRLVADDNLRRRLIRGGHETAAAHTLDRQAGEMVRALATRTGLTFRDLAASPLTTVA